MSALKIEFPTNKTHFAQKMIQIGAATDLASICSFLDETKLNTKEFSIFLFILLHIHVITFYVNSDYIWPDVKIILFKKIFSSIYLIFNNLNGREAGLTELVDQNNYDFWIHYGRNNGNSCENFNFFKNSKKHSRLIQYTLLSWMNQY